MTRASFNRFDPRLLESARTALAEYQGKENVTVADLLTLYRNPDDPRCQKSLGADFLRYALQALILNEKRRSDLRVKPLENPALRDFYNLLAGRKHVPALAVMFGIELMDKLFQPEIQNTRTQNMQQSNCIYIHIHTTRNTQAIRVLRRR